MASASAGYARMNIESKYPDAVVLEILGVTLPPAVVRLWNPAQEKTATAEKRGAPLVTSEDWAGSPGAKLRAVAFCAIFHGVGRRAFARRPWP